MSWLSKNLKKAEHWISSKIPHTHSSEKRAAMAAAKEQIDFYKQQKEDLIHQREENEQEKSTERARINEKQIRARQRQYRRGGFMAPASSDIKDQLG